MWEFLQHNWFWALLAAVSGAWLLWQILAQSGGEDVSVAQATLMINREDALVVDVRESAEWSAGHIPHARHIALGQLASRLAELEKYKDKPVIMVCASGNRSSSGCSILKKAGFSRVFNLSGGMRAWIEAGLPVAKK
ncbi:MAG: rhodanese-like domain-containing protein [Rhodocyclaceae bacterium]|nr:rhodanese-like domain-containing protein [Rhodocyclaceae bacterium]